MTFLYSFIAVLAGCADPVTVDLVDEALWAQVSDEDDPYTEWRPGERVCDPSGILREDGLVEVNTLDCPWATVSQPLPIALRRGDVLEALVFHGPLIFDAEAEGRTVLDVGDLRLVDETVAIPTVEQFYSVELELEADIDAGDIVWHVHNHGGNDWRMSHLRVTSGRAAIRDFRR